MIDARISLKLEREQYLLWKYRGARELKTYCLKTWPDSAILRSYLGLVALSEDIGR
jgi:hypothetical protein